MIERAYIKSNARKNLKGKFFLIMITVLIGGLLSNLDILNPQTYSFEVSEPTFMSRSFTILSFLLRGLMNYGIARFCINIVKNRDEAQFTDLFSGFSVYVKTLGLNIIIVLSVMLGTILFIIPGIIISLMFLQAYYILCEDNSKSIIKCLKESSEMMKGHKRELFLLQLSFLGWMLLIIVTAGIASLWVEPYIQLTFCNYYLELKGIGSEEKTHDEL